MTIQDLLKAKRNELNLTQEEMAKQVGKNIQVYRSWEQGRNSPSLESCQVISDKMNIDFNLLVQAKLNRRKTNEI